MVRPFLVLIAMVALTTACSGVREAIIPGKQAPDEFAVFSRAPLSLPPEYELRAPEPGAERPQNVNPSDVVQRLTVGLNDDRPTASSGVEELLERTGAKDVDPQIRQLVNNETSALAQENDTVINSILFWQDNSTAVEVDPDEEAKRIRQSQALGDPISGDDVPIIEKKQKGLLEGIF